MTKYDDKICKFGQYTLIIGDPIIISFGNIETNIVVEVLGTVGEKSMYQSPNLIGWEIGRVDRNREFIPCDKHLISIHESKLCSIKVPFRVSKTYFESNGEVYSI